MSQFLAGYIIGFTKVYRIIMIGLEIIFINYGFGFSYGYSNVYNVKYNENIRWKCKVILIYRPKKLMLKLVV